MANVVSLDVKTFSPITVIVTSPTVDPITTGSIVFYKNGVVDTSSLVTVSVVGSHFAVTFTIKEEGLFSIVVNDVVMFYVTATDQSVTDYLQDLKDESLGSWVWDKTTGSLVMKRQDGSTLASFATTDDVNTTTRTFIPA